MSSCRELTNSFLTSIVLALASATVQAQSATYPGVGRAATASEITAWDIDVRPDFKGLPKGSGSVAKGMEVWEAKCASCHGVFGESNQVFSPIVGGTTAQDVKSGHVERLNDAAYPGRTTLMKLATLSTLWDYINRAMPWTSPKSLSIEEVYAVTAYILNMGNVLPDNFVLSDQNMAEVQQRLPNRNGMSTSHALWPGAGLSQRAPDVKASACMKDCGPAPKLASFLPDFARDAHGNLSEQNRAVGAQHGADTRRPVPAGAAVVTTAPTASVGPARNAESGASTAAVIALTQKHGCASCHGMENKIVGPSFRDVAKKYASRADAAGYVTSRIKAGSSGVWGAIPMPPQTLTETDAKAIAQWLTDGARK